MYHPTDRWGLRFVDPILMVMGAADVVGGLLLLGIGGDIANLVAYILLFKGGTSLLSTPM